MAETIEIIFEGNETDFIAAAKKVDAETKRFNDTLKKAGVSQSAYNKVVQQSQTALRAQAAAASSANTATAKSSSIFSGLGKSLGGMINPTTLLIGGLTALVGVVKGSYGDFQAYAGSVRDLALVSGTGAEESSKLLQVLDDFEISAEDVTVATKKMTANGLVPTVDTLAKLSDQYLAINDPMERNEFVLKNLGKAGLEWVNVLSQGSEALRASGEDVNKNLILTDEQIKKAEQARLAVDAWGDAWMGFKVSIGSAIGSIIVANDEMSKAAGITADLATEYEKSGNAAYEQSGRVKGMSAGFRDYVAAARANAAATERLTGLAARYAMTVTTVIKSLDGMTGSLEEVSAQNADLINDAISIQASQDKYNESQQETLDKIAALQEEKAGMYKWERDDIAKVEEKISDLTKEYDKSAAEFVEAQKTKFAMMAIEAIALQDGIAGYSEAEAEKALSLLDTANIAEKAAVREAIAMDMVRQKIEDGLVPLAEMEEILRLMSEGYTIDVAVNIAKNTTINENRGGQAAADEENGGSGNKYAHGGQFTIPSSYGYEGFNMGGMATASAGETVTVSTKAQTQAAQQSGGMSIDYKKLALVLRDTLAQAG